VNAPFGEFAQATLAASTRALKSTDDTEYNSIEDSITSLTSQRDALADQIRSALNDAAFNGTTITESQAQGWISEANSLISQAQALPH
jgi:DNA-binding ferritin-like protein